jgi:matrixin
MRRGLIGVLVIVALALWAPMAKATDNLCLDSSTGDPYCKVHWSTLSIPYRLNSSLPSDWKSAIRSAMSSWAVNTNITTFADGGETNTTDWAPNDSQIIWRGPIPAELQAGCPPSNTLACTALNWEGYVGGEVWHLYDADMVFNSSMSFGTSACYRKPVPLWLAAGYDVETLALHELGHWIGINHTPDTGAAMYPSYQECNRALSYHDWQSGNALYDGHGHA